MLLSCKFQYWTAVRNVKWGRYEPWSEILISHFTFSKCEPGIEHETWISFLEKCALGEGHGSENVFFRFSITSHMPRIRDIRECSLRTGQVEMTFEFLTSKKSRWCQRMEETSKQVPRQAGRNVPPHSYLCSVTEHSSLLILAPGKNLVERLCMINWVGSLLLGLSALNRHRSRSFGGRRIFCPASLPSSFPVNYSCESCLGRHGCIGRGKSGRYKTQIGKFIKCARKM